MRDPNRDVSLAFDWVSSISRACARAKQNICCSKRSRSVTQHPMGVLILEFVLSARISWTAIAALVNFAVKYRYGTGAEKVCRLRGDQTLIALENPVCIMMASASNISLHPHRRIRVTAPGLGFGGETKAPARVKGNQPKPKMTEEELRKCVCNMHVTDDDAPCKMTLLVTVMPSCAQGPGTWEGREDCAACQV